MMSEPQETRSAWSLIQRAKERFGYLRELARVLFEVLAYAKVRGIVDTSCRPVRTFAYLRPSPPHLGYEMRELSDRAKDEFDQLTFVYHLMANYTFALPPGYVINYRIF